MLSFVQEKTYQNYYYMRTVEFITLAGLEIGIDQELLYEANVSRKAGEYYKTEVKCTPCVFAGVYGMKSGSIGWKIEKQEDSSLLGFMVLVTGSYANYPVDFGSEELKMIIPIGQEWARFYSFKVRYFNGALEIEKVK